MKYHTSDNWNKDIDLDGVLYFSHRCEEMLFHYASEKYKVPMFNTRLLLSEYLLTNKLVNYDNIADNNLDYVYEEFKLSLDNDIAISEGFGRHNVDKLFKKLGSLSKNNKLQMYKYLQSVMDNFQYYEWCKTALLKYLKMPREKKIIENLTRSIIPEIISNGYSQEYIFFALKESFVNNSVDDYSCIDKFFSHFDFSLKEYNVYIAIDKKGYEIIKQHADKALNISFDDDGYYERYKIDKNKYIIRFNAIKSRDIYTAMNTAFNSLSLWTSFFTFLSDKKIGRPQDTGMVRQTDSDICHFCDVNNRSYNIVNPLEHDDVAKAINHRVPILMANSRRDFPTIKKVVDLHNTAITINDYRSSFLCFWSIMEVICVRDKEKPKIKQIIDHATSIMKKDYFEDVLCGLCESVEKCIPSQANDIFSDIEGSPAEKVASIIFLPEYNEYREKLINSLSEFPVLRSRISQLKGMSSNPKKLLEEVERYGQRITWHMYRMYRTRNLIIHAGESPENLKLLGEHLHSYVDAILHEIFLRMSSMNNLRSIENALVEASLSYEIYMELFSKDRFTSEDLKVLVHPHVNSL